MNCKIVCFYIILILILPLSCHREDSVQLSENMVLKFMTAQSLYYKGENGQAITILGSIYKENPGFLRSTSLYARALFYSGEKEKAVTIWEELCGSEVFYIDGIKHLSRFYLSEGRGREAEEMIMEALSYSSEDPGLIYLLAEARISEGKLSDGLALLERAEILNEKNCEIYLKQAPLYQEYGYYDKALDAVEKSAALLDENHPLYSSVIALKGKLSKEIP